MPLRLFFHQAVLPIRLAHASHRTVEHYRLAISKLEQFLGRSAFVADLSSEAITALMRHAVARGRSVSYANTLRKELLALSGIAHRDGLNREAARSPKFPRLFWSPGQVACILRVASMARGVTPAGVAMGGWWRALILLQIDTGATLSDVTALRGQDVDAAAGVVQLRTGAHIAHETTRQALTAIAAPPRSRLFEGARGHSQRHDRLWREYRRIVFAAGVLPPAEAVRRGDLFERLRNTGRVFSLDDVTNAEARLAATIPTHAPLTADLLLPGPVAETQLVADARPASLEPRNWRNRDNIQAIKAPPGALTLRALYRERYSQVRLLSPAGRAEFCCTLNRLDDCLGFELTMDRLDDNTIERFMAWLHKAGRRPATVNKHRGNLVALWTFAQRKKLRDDLPRVERLRTPRRLPTSWTVEELRTLMAAIAELKGHIEGIDERLWWGSLVATLYVTGMRVGAALSLRICDYSPTRGTVRALAENQKQRAEQVFGLSLETTALINASLAQSPGREFLFPWTFDKNDRSRQALLAGLRRILKRAGLSHGSRDLFHKLRRTTGTLVADILGEETASRLLGHSSVQVTRNYYIDPSGLRSVQHVARAMPPLTGWTHRAEAAEVCVSSETRLPALA